MKRLTMLLVLLVLVITATSVFADPAYCAGGGLDFGRGCCACNTSQTRCDCGTEVCVLSEGIWQCQPDQQQSGGGSGGGW